MKRRLSFIVMLMLCLSVFGQVKNYITFSGQLGEASYLYNIKDVSSNVSFGIGNGVGVGYEMRASAFLLNVGVGINFTHSIANVGELTQTLKDQKDDDWISGGELFDYTYTQTHRHDSYSNLSVQVPLMIGAAVKRFYFLAGAKLDLSVLARSEAKATISSTMKYHDYPSPVPDMENHGVFKNALIIQKPVKVEFSPQVMASAEIGYRFVTVASGRGWDVPKEERNYWRVALFADYGLFDIHKKENNDFITFPSEYSSDATKMKDITINHIFSTKQAENSVRNLMVGVKVTYLFQLPEKQKCVMCQAAKNSSGGGKGKGRIQMDWTHPK